MIATHEVSATREPISISITAKSNRITFEYRSAFFKSAISISDLISEMLFGALSLCVAIFVPQEQLKIVNVEFFGLFGEEFDKFENVRS